MNEHSLEKEIGVTREGKVLRRSWFAPLVFLAVAVMIFLVYGIRIIEKVEVHPLILIGWDMILPTLRFQLETVSKLALYSLLPGLAGLIYRRAFWRWFLAAFVILFLINSVSIYMEWGSIAETKTGGKVNFGGPVGQTKYVDTTIFNLPFPFFFTSLLIELLLIEFLLIWRLRKHSTEYIDFRTKVRKIILAAFLVLLGIGLGYVVFMHGYEVRNRADDIVPFILALFLTGATFIAFLLSAYLLVASAASTVKQGTTAKNIVVCLDGTWNEPGTTDFGYLAETNVFKLFKLLKGKTSRRHFNANQGKEYLDDKQFSKQIAFYYHGVGNKFENSELGQLFGGVFGMGAEAIVQRAYLDVMRVYRPGDRIFIFGFSRGAAIARVLAGTIGRRGAPRSLWTLRLFGRHWPVWKSSTKIEDVPVEVLGCWDTVGAFGIAKNILGIPFQKINLLKDLNVSLCVKRAYHMVALDETRDSFEPTLMDPDPTTPGRITEVWFSGNHANVGGGYATDKLSNLTLDFLLRHISSGYACESGMQPGDESWGLYLSALRKGQSVDGDVNDIPVIDPDSREAIRRSTGQLYSHAPRNVPIHAVIHDSVFERMKNALPVYAPQSLFNVNEELVKTRMDIETEIKKLVESRSLQDEEAKEILALSQDKLTLTKWSTFLRSKTDAKLAFKDKREPAEQLSNPPMLLMETAG